VLSTADAKVFVDALLVSQSHGLIAFDLSSHLDPHPSEEQIAGVTERQDQIYASIYNKLNTHKDLRKGRALGVTINVLTCHPALEGIIQRDDVLICAPEKLSEVIKDFEPVEEVVLRPLNAAVQRVSTLRPLKRRENVTKENSRGAILKRIE